MNKIQILLSTLILFTSVTFADPVTPESQAPCSNMVYNGTFPKAKEQLTIICHKAYVVGFSTTRHSPLWSAEILTDNQVNAEGTERENDFRPDPAIPANLQSSPKAYIDTGFDKGHLNNYADVSSDPVAADESFFMTNIVPQKAKNNRGIWRSLEIHVRKIAQIEHTVYVVTGVMFNGDVATLKDGTPIPTHLYKIIIAPKSNKIYTFIIPNVNGLSAAMLKNYSTTVKDLQASDPIVDVLPNPPQEYTDVHGFE